MKIIFLDCDGVINCQSDYRQIQNPFPINPKLAAYVSILCRMTGARIVLTSTWRKVPEAVEVIKASVLGKWMFEDGANCTDTNGPSRGHEIQRWLDDNYIIPGDDMVDNYVILEDDPDEHMDPNHLVKTSWLRGFTVDKFDEALEILS